eukprot:3942008-Rhodomonas_salina.5
MLLCVGDSSASVPRGARGGCGASPAHTPVGETESQYQTAVGDPASLYSVGAIASQYQDGSTRYSNFCTAAGVRSAWRGGHRVHAEVVPQETHGYVLLHVVLEHLVPVVEELSSRRRSHLGKRREEEGMRSGESRQERWRGLSAGEDVNWTGDAGCCPKT